MQRARGSVGNIFTNSSPHPHLEPGTRVLDLNKHASGTLLGWKADGMRYHDTSGGLSSDGVVRIFYDDPGTYEGNPWNVSADNIIFLDAAAPDPPEHTLSRQHRNISEALADRTTQRQHMVQRAQLHSHECQPLTLSHSHLASLTRVSGGAACPASEADDRHQDDERAP